MLESAPLDEFLLLSEHLRRIAERAEAAGGARRPCTIEEMEMLAALTAEYDTAVESDTSVTEQVASSAFFLFGVPFKTNFDKEVPHELGATPDRVFATIPHEGK